MLLRLHNDAIDNTGLCCREFLLYNKMAWGMKWEIIKNTECYKGIDLINASGTVKINIANDSYITYGSSIVKVFTTILVQFENGKGTPTYSDAIERARKEVIDKACDGFDTYVMEIGYPDDWMRDSLNIESEKERFRKAMLEM